MSADIFVSYAWTSDAHRAWVRLLASHMHLIGYAVAIDATVDYGSSLTGFMREVTDAKHVLMVVDDNYVYRADSVPGSGVAIENEWIRSVYGDRESGWLGTLFVNNAGCCLPAWLRDHQPKGFNFNSPPARPDYPGSEQINELWRWAEGLPADKANAVPWSVLRNRASRLEHIDNLRDPGRWRSPAMSGTVRFDYNDHPNRTYTLGYGEFEFAVSVSGAGNDNIYVYADSMKAVGLILTDDYDEGSVSKFLSPGRTVTPRVGQRVVVLNHNGALCVIRIDAVQREVNGSEYVAPYVTFGYDILVNQ